MSPTLGVMVSRTLRYIGSYMTLEMRSALQRNSDELESFVTNVDKDLFTQRCNTTYVQDCNLSFPTIDNYNMANVRKCYVLRNVSEMNPSEHIK
jgi:hypothetical protein